MLPFILGGVALAGLAKLAYDFATREAPVVPSRPLTRLGLNLTRLRGELAIGKGPALAIMGQPGAGTSSLLSKIGGRRLTPKPSIGVETDATDWAGSDECVLLFSCEPWRIADVPGYDTQGHPAAAFLADFPFSSFDVFVFVVRGKLREADESVYRRLTATGKPVLVVRGFADGIDNEEVVGAVQDIRRRLGVPESVKVVPVSNRSGIGINIVRRWLRAQARPKELTMT